MLELFENQNYNEEDKLNLNIDYSRNYNSWRQKEELHKLKSKYGKDIELPINLEESSESSEDDDGKEIPEQFEKSFYKTLAYLKNKDPKIYDNNVQFFKEPDVKEINKSDFKEKNEKSLFLRDYERTIILEGKLNYSEDEMKKNEKNETSFYNTTYVKQQQELKDSFKKIFENNEENYKEDTLLKPKIKTKQEIQKEENDYKEWLKGHIKNISTEEKKVFKSLQVFWNDPKLNENEKFLRDYILNKKFLDKQMTNYDFNYDHVTHTLDENLSEDEQNINQQEEFEHKYNFRFEEPDQEFLKRYPRTLENSLRKKDNRRARKRAEVKIRKKQEQINKKEEIKYLRALKKKEMEEKLDKIKEITGNDGLNLNILDLEGDFEPDEYDKKMRAIFSDEYYTKHKDDIKPEFPDIDKELCIESVSDKYYPPFKSIEDKNSYYGPLHCEDPEFNMDAEYDYCENKRDKLTQSNKTKKHRRCSKFTEKVLKEKPQYDPMIYSSYKEYYDQYYALNYEDLIGDLPCRFKYREVVPNDYGLSIKEILMADDRELNKWCSLKKALEYKSDYKEFNDVKLYKQKGSNEALKKKILKSLYNPERDENESSTDSQKFGQNTIKYKCKMDTKLNIETITEQNNDNINENSLKNDENIKNLYENDIQVDEQKKNIKKEYSSQHLQYPEKNSNIKKIQNSIKESDNTQNIKYLAKSKSKKKTKNFTNNISSIQKKKKQLKKFKNKINVYKEDQIDSLSAERLKAYGLNPKKFRNKLKYKNK